ncbi:hypothetical protein [Streptomyces mutabilis]|uniref:hypothetical protein n=1 Tax=Streptomyces mutabilis TaxID=67332 RepID=UPI0012B68D4A|nr:hypothetical protein [Streptomyces mutabilis]
MPEATAGPHGNMRSPLPRSGGRNDGLTLRPAAPRPPHPAHQDDQRPRGHDQGEHTQQRTVGDPVPEP